LRWHRQGKVRDFYNDIRPTVFTNPTHDLVMHDGGDRHRSQDVSVEQVAALARQNTLPEPTLDISLLSYSATTTTATATTTTTTAVPTTANSSSSNGGSSVRGHGVVVSGSAALRNSTAVVLPPPADDPWMTGRFGGAGTFPGADATSAGINGGGVPSSVAGTGLPSGWWKKQESASVQFGGQQGFVLNRYMVYGITTEVRKKGKTHTHTRVVFLLFPRVLSSLTT
jgi:sorting nexin-8